MNLLLHAALGIGSLALHAYINGMDLCHNNQPKILVQRALNTIASYNQTNSREVAIDPKQYLDWLMQNPIPQNSQNTDFANPAHSDEVIISTVMELLNVKGIRYSEKKLKPLSISLNHQLNQARLNRLLDSVSASGSDQEYWKRRRLVAVLICAGADANQTQKKDAMSVLGQAVLYDDIPAALLLLKHHADPNTSLTDFLPAPLIWYANSVAMVQVLMNYGAHMPPLSNTNPLSDCDKERYNHLQKLFKEYNHHLAQKID